MEIPTLLLNAHFGHRPSTNGNRDGDAASLVAGASAGASAGGVSGSSGFTDSQGTQALATQATQSKDFGAFGGKVKFCV
jgi:hypothetical protein